MSEPIHPTYGTLDQLLAVIGRDVRDGYEVRLGLLGALAWFGTRYGEQRAADNSSQPLAAHTHTDECWEPDSGCDMGRNEKFVAASQPTAARYCGETTNVLRGVTSVQFEWTDDDGVVRRGNFIAADNSPEAKP